MFVYKEDDVQKMAQDIKNSERKQKQSEINAVVDEMTRAHSAKTNKFET